jgi:hypothetical protein
MAACTVDFIHDFIHAFLIFTAIVVIRLLFLLLNIRHPASVNMHFA